MIVRINRDDSLYGTIQCSPAPNNSGRIDVTVWFCPQCGRIYAREYIEFDEGESTYPFYYHVIDRPCTIPLFDLYIPHPTMWNCADRTMLKSALEEYLNGDDPSKCPAAAA